jgi:hypothetical protein
LSSDENNRYTNKTKGKTEKLAVKIKTAAPRS